MTAKPEFRGCAAAMMAAALLLAPPAWGGKPSPTRAPAPPTLREVARDFESRRLIAGAERVTFLRGTQEAVRALLAGELPAEQKFAARYLAGTLSFELGDYRAASESFDRAVLCRLQVGVHQIVHGVKLLVPGSGHFHLSSVVGSGRFGSQVRLDGILP